MPETIELPNGRRYNAADAFAIQEWVGYTTSLLTLHPDEAEHMIEALKLLGARAQAQYVELESGGRVELRLEDAEGMLAAFPDLFADAFVGMSGQVLLLCVDGPTVGAALLAEQVSYLRGVMPCR